MLFQLGEIRLYNFISLFNCIYCIVIISWPVLMNYLTIGNRRFEGDLAIGPSGEIRAITFSSLNLFRAAF